MIARIAVAAAVYAIDKPYSYCIPEGMELRPGMRVRVPFGAGNRRTEGMVLRVEAGETEGLKRVDEALDAEPLLSERMLRLAGFLRERYFCTFYDAVRAILPAGLWFTEDGTVSLTDPLPEDWEARTRRKPGTQGLIRALAELGGSAPERQLRAMLPELDLPEAIRYLSGKKLLQVDYSLKRRVRDRMDLFVRLEVSPAEAMEYSARRARSAPLQRSVLELLCQLGSACAKDVCYFTGASMPTLRRLEKLGMVSFFSCEVLRRTKVVPARSGGPVELNADQQAAFSGLCAQMARPEPGVALLYGVTGSGKTAVYLRLIERCIAAGRQAGPTSASGWRCCIPACQLPSATTNGSGCAPGRPTWWSAPGPRCSRRRRSSASSLWTRSTSTPINPKIPPIITPARWRSTAAAPKGPWWSWARRPRRWRACTGRRPGFTNYTPCPGAIPGPLCPRCWWWT